MVSEELVNKNEGSGWTPRWYHKILEVGRFCQLLATLSSSPITSSLMIDPNPRSVCLAGPFALQVRGVGHFARKGRASALWAAFEPSEGLAILERRVERACRAAGLPPETRKFVPHVTLARTNASTGPIGGWLAEHGRLAPPPWRVEAFHLYESRLEPGGAHYEPVLRFPLAS
ncbi:MAG: RNA 2',3'-cyclic phosphodiesterase [Pirellulaceae bacterium]